MGKRVIILGWSHIGVPAFSVLHLFCYYLMYQYITDFSRKWVLAVPVSLQASCTDSLNYCTWDFLFCKVFEPIILSTMAIATLVVLLMTLTSCIKIHILTCTRISGATSTAWAVSAKQSLLPQKFYLHVQRPVWDSQENS